MTIPPAAVASITLTTPSPTIQVGETVSLTVALKAADGQPVSGRPIAWVSDSSDIASVDATGSVVGLRVGGPVKVSATAEGQSAFVSVTVIATTSARITESGGSISLPTGVSVTVSPMAVAGAVSFALRDTVVVSPTYTQLSTRGVQLVVPLDTTTVRFQEGGFVEISLPISRDPTPSTATYVRARIKGIQETFWAPVTVAAGRQARIRIPSSGFYDFARILRLDSLRLTLDVEEFNGPPRPASALFTKRSGQQSASFASASECRSLPSEFATNFADCSGGSIKELRAATGTGRVAVVLIHGWLPDVGDYIDFYHAQGLRCSAFLFWSCNYDGDLRAAASLPASEYFGGQLNGLTRIEGLRDAVLKDPRIAPEVPVFAFTYQPYRDIAESATMLADALEAKKRDSMGAIGGFVIVAHSMGGLVTRSAMQLLEARTLNAQTILGAITLGTPHLGTPLPRAQLAGLFVPGIWTPGAASMIGGLPGRNEKGALIAYGGVGPPCIPLGVNGCSGGYFVTAGVLCARYFECTSDGVVPIASALPDFGPSVIRRRFDRYTHTDLINGIVGPMASDALYSQLSIDLQSLLARAGASSLAFTQGPSTTSSNAAIAPTIKVAVLDGKGQPIVATPFEITLSLSGGTAGATLTGTRTATTVNGVASFPNIAVDRAGTGYRLLAEILVNGVPSVTSSAFTVNAGPPPAPVATVTVAPATSSVAVGATVPLTATLRDAGGNVLTGRVTTWTSSAPTVASVSSSGLVTALTVGTTTITATSEPGSGSATVNVSPGGAGCGLIAKLGCGFGDEQFATIAAGSFQMGTNAYTSFEQPIHTVTISSSFQIQRTEVTQYQWKLVMNSNPASFTSCGLDCPVEAVSWAEVQEFISRLNTLFPGHAYRLPTEAEWEFAARSGSTQDRYGVLGDIAWYAGNSAATSHPVAQLLPNRSGLYDILGNVSEWVNDWCSLAVSYPSAPVTDPQGALTGDVNEWRCVRGRSFSDPDYSGLSVAGRGVQRYSQRDYEIGFRLVRSR